MNNKKFTKKEIKFYNDNFIKLMNIIKAKQIESWHNAYFINSNYGKFYIYKDSLDGDTILSIHTEFEEPKKAKEKFNCNPYTGKYNFYEKNIKEGLWLLHDIICEVLEVEELGEFIE